MGCYRTRGAPCKAAGKDARLLHIPLPDSRTLKYPCHDRTPRSGRPDLSVCSYRSRAGPMRMRKLGSAGLVSSAIGLGTAALTGSYGPVTKRECARVIRLALEVGITMLDTSDFYANGEM